MSDDYEEDHEEDHDFLHDQAEATAFTYLYIKFDGEMECVGEALSNLLSSYLIDPRTDRKHADWIMGSLQRAYLTAARPVGNA